MPEVCDGVAQHLVGRQHETLMILAALMSGRHVFLEGPPGTSKSTILKAITQEMRLPFVLVTGNSDLTCTKLLGYFDPARALGGGYKAEFFEFGPLTEAMSQGAILYIEEFNRLPDDTCNAFFTAASEGAIAIARLGIVKAQPSFRIVATMNPYDDTGTSRVSLALRDRFCSIEMKYQTREQEIEIVRLRTGSDRENLIEMAVEIGRRTRDHAKVRLGASVRGSIDMVLIVGRLLDAAGRDADAELMLAGATMAFRDKIWMSETSKLSPAEVIEQIWRDVSGEGLWPSRLNAPPPAGGDAGAKTGDMDGTGQGRADETLWQAPDRATDVRRPIAMLTKDEWRLMTEHPGADADHHVDSPLDLKIASALQQGQVDAAISLAQVAPGRVARYVTRHRPVMQRLARSEADEAERLLRLIWDGLDAETKADHLQDMIQVVHRIAALARPGRRRPDGPPRPTSYRFNAAEIDVDGTVDRLVADPILSYQSLMVLEPIHRPRAYVLILDKSGSMKGSKGVTCAVAAAALLLNVQRGEERGVVAFDDTPSLILTLGAPGPCEEIIGTLLGIESEGCTDIAAALELGLTELSRSRAKTRVGILVTDGWNNVGADPLALASHFSRLHILVLPGGDMDLCQQMSRAGHARAMLVEELVDLPRSLRGCLN